MISSVSQLFDSPGYIPAKEYLDDITSMRKYGPWKLPLGAGDRIHFFLLKSFLRFSWFSSRLFIKHTEMMSPAYTLLLAYLKRQGIFDTVTEKHLHYRGVFSFHLEKDIAIKNRTVRIMGQGVATDRATALSVAIGEMIERMVTGLYDMNKNIIHSSADSLQKNYAVVYPPKYHRHLDIQKKRYKELEPDPGRDIGWMQGENLITGELTYIPKQLTSWFKERTFATHLFVHATTNGSAGFFDRDTAVLGGILEVVQRDGFLVHWLTTISPRRIKTDTLPEFLLNKVKEFERIGVTLNIVDVTSLSIPSVFIVAINSYGSVRQVTLSGNSALTFEDAISGALREISVGIEMFYYEKSLEESEGIDKTIKPFTSNLDKIARQLYWRGNEQVEKIEWFISGKEVSFEEISKNNLSQGRTSREKIDICLEVLKKYGEEYHPVVYYPKNKIQETLGFYVAQVFIPKAFPFYLFEGYGTFDSDRLQDFAKGKGVEDWTLNPEPHMFS